jgi:hypothetical protein
MGDLAVAAGVNPSGGALDMYSKILGIKQATQNLQTGQYVQQQQQSDAQLSQQQMAERQLLQQTLQTQKMPDGTPITTDQPSPVTGRFEPDPDKLRAFAQRYLPLTGQAVQQSLTKTQADKTSLLEASRGLQGNYRGDLAGIINGFKGTQASSQDINNALDEYGRRNPDAIPAIHYASNLIDSGLHTVQNQTARDSYLGTIVQHLQPADVTAAQQAIRPTTNAAGQVIGARSVGGGTGIELSPATEATTVGGGSPRASLNPTTASVARQTTAATGESGGDVDTYNTIKAEGSNAAAVRGLAGQVVNMAQDVDTGVMTGTTAKVWAGMAQRFGYKPTDIDDPGVRRAILDKIAAQLRSQSLTNAHSPEARDAIQGAFPDPTTMPAGAVAEAARYVDGTAAMQSERLKNAEQFRKTNGGSVVGLNQVDSKFKLNADPYAFHYAELPPGAQRQQFLKQHFTHADGTVDTAGMQRLLQNVNGIKHLKAQNGTD